MTKYYDIWQKEEGNTIIPVEIDVQADSPEQACEIIAREKGLDASQLQASEASNPGYREV